MAQLGARGQQFVGKSIPPQDAMKRKHSADHSISWAVEEQDNNVWERRGWGKRGIKRKIL